MKGHLFTKATLPYSIPICLECRTVFEIQNLKINYKNELSLHYKCQCPHTKYVNFDSYYYGLNLLKSLERNKCSDNTYSSYYCLDCKAYVSSSNEKKHSSHFLSDYYIKDYYLMCSFHKNKKLLYHCKTCDTYICSFCKNTTHKKHQLILLTEYNIKKIKAYIKQNLNILSNNPQIDNKINILIELYLKALNSNKVYTHYYLINSLFNLTEIEYTTLPIKFIQNNRLHYLECKGIIDLQYSSNPFLLQLKRKMNNNNPIVRNIISLSNNTFLIDLYFITSEKRKELNNFIDKIHTNFNYGENTIIHNLMDPKYKDYFRKYKQKKEEVLESEHSLYFAIHVDKYFQKELSVIIFYQKQFITKYENNICICADNTRMIFYDFTDTAKAIRYIINNHAFSIEKLLCKPDITTVIGIDDKGTFFYFNQTDYCSITFKQVIENILLYKEDKVLLSLCNQVIIYSLKDKKQVHSFVPYDEINIHSSIEECALSNDYQYFIMEGCYQENVEIQEGEEDKEFYFVSIYDLVNKKMIMQKMSYLPHHHYYIFENVNNIEKLFKSGELIKEHNLQIVTNSYYKLINPESINLQYGYNISISEFYIIFLYRGWIKDEYV